MYETMTSNKKKEKQEMKQKLKEMSALKKFIFVLGDVLFFGALAVETIMENPPQLAIVIAMLIGVVMEAGILFSLRNK